MPAPELFFCFFFLLYVCLLIHRLTETHGERKLEGEAEKEKEKKETDQQQS